MRRNSYRIVLGLLLAVLMVVPGMANAQSSSLLYGSSRNPQETMTNPAFFPRNSSGYLSLPTVSLGFNSPLAYSSIFHYDSTDDKTHINLNNMLDTMANGEKLRLGVGVLPIGLGLNFNKFFITLSSQAKVDVRFGLPSGIVTFLNEGNYGHTGDDAIELLNGDLISARVYGEAALGFGYRINDRLTVGARVKLLAGLLDLSNGGSSMTLVTAPDYSSMTANLNLNLNYAGLMSINYDSVSGKTNMDFNAGMPKSLGFNFDLGARYATDLFEVSGSILDLGPGIHWKDNIRKVVSAHENNSFTFSGVDVSTYLQGGTLDSTFTQMLLDSLKALTDYKVIDDGSGDYWTSIPTKVNLGGMFHPTSWASVGLMFHGEFERGLVKVGDVFKTKTVAFYSRTSLVARVGYKDWIEFVASASVISNKNNWDWFNPGLGLTLTPMRTLQIYVFLDYISNIYLVDAKNINLSLGINLLFGKSNQR